MRSQLIVDHSEVFHEWKKVRRSTYVSIHCKFLDMHWFFLNLNNHSFKHKPLQKSISPTEDSLMHINYFWNSFLYYTIIIIFTTNNFFIGDRHAKSEFFGVSRSSFYGLGASCEHCRQTIHRNICFCVLLSKQKIYL